MAFALGNVTITNDVALATNISFATGLIGSPALPLTTIFTPLSVCTDASLVAIQSQSNVLTYSPTVTSATCSPGRLADVLNTTGIFSPGVCPLSWTAYPISIHLVSGTTDAPYTTEIVEVYQGDSISTQTETDTDYYYTGWTSMITQCVCCPR